ncbi:hypothetical protein C1H46_021524 [Malus baccata]|uniref:Pentatricopeptide repeat-containing protein n=1 Tax=Malus baccata TaxID=106549 RepID=A0A540M284_MALBA|nr:hypothetical protein C1H46_021524 [Malus baccata]
MPTTCSTKYPTAEFSSSGPPSSTPMCFTIAFINPSLYMLKCTGWGIAILVHLLFRSQCLWSCPGGFRRETSPREASAVWFLGNGIVQTALLHMYAKCGLVRDARDVFDSMEDKDLVAWTAMIFGFSKMGLMGEARWLFDNMGQRNAVSWATIVAGYTNNGDMERAKELYERMVYKNSVAWVAMIAGYGKRGNVVEAEMVFDEIQMPDASCWAAMVACYAQNGYAAVQQKPLGCIRK